MPDVPGIDDTPEEVIDGYVPGRGKLRIQWRHAVPPPVFEDLDLRYHPHFHETEIRTALPDGGLYQVFISGVTPDDIDPEKLVFKTRRRRAN